MIQSPQELPPKPEHQGPVPIIWIDATKERYQAGLQNFSNVDRRIETSPDTQHLVGEDFDRGNVVLRGFHRFAKSPAELEQLLEHIRQHGLDRAQEATQGESLHVVASFVNDNWDLALPYTTERLHTKPPKNTNHSYGLILAYDNADGGVCYLDQSDRTIYTKDNPQEERVHMSHRDEQMVATILTSPTRQVPGWKERLAAIIVIEYPLLEREKKSIAKTIKDFFK